MIELFLGGARSGKTRHAEVRARQLSETQNLPVFYVATGQPLDDEMAARINRHQADRPSDWQTIEAPIYLADVLKNLSNAPCVIIIDCLTLWLSNLVCHDDKTLFSDQKSKLLAQLHSLQSSVCHVIMVSNETGLGVVPMGKLSREFVDESGFLHQKLATLADSVTFFVAGLPMVLKSADMLR